jgi:hypothetical protein
MVVVIAEKLEARMVAKVVEKVVAATGVAKVGVAMVEAMEAMEAERAVVMAVAVRVEAVGALEVKLAEKVEALAGSTVEGTAATAAMVAAREAWVVQEAPAVMEEELAKAARWVAAQVAAPKAVERVVAWAGLGATPEVVAEVTEVAATAVVTGATVALVAEPEAQVGLAAVEAVRAAAKAASRWQEQRTCPVHTVQARCCQSGRSSPLGMAHTRFRSTDRRGR